MLTRIDPPIPMRAKGMKGLAHFVIDYGVEHDLMWVMFLDNCEVWCVGNKDVRADTNWSFGRK
jgi:hypothetical protein